MFGALQWSHRNVNVHKSDPGQVPIIPKSCSSRAYDIGASAPLPIGGLPVVPVRPVPRVSRLAYGKDAAWMATAVKKDPPALLALRTRRCASDDVILETSFSESWTSDAAP